MIKKQLYNFIDKKTTAKKRKVKEKFEEDNKKLVKQIVDSLDYESVQAAEDTIRNFLANIDEIVNVSIGYCRLDIKDLRDGLNNNKDFKKWLTGNLENRFTSEYELYEPESNWLKQITAKHNHLIIEKRKTISDINTLDRELKSIVANYSAKKAYQELKKVGLDMSDFKEDADMLPAPVKLSVSVDLINK